MQIFGQKILFLWTKSHVFWKSTKFVVTIMEGHQKDNILVLTLLHGEPWGDRGAHFWPGNMHLFQSYNHLATIFWVRQIQLNGIISPLYPKVTLDTFGFLENTHLAGWRVVLWPWLPKITLFGARKCRLLHPKCCDLGNNKTCTGKNTCLNFCIRLTHEESLH